MTAIAASDPILASSAFTTLDWGVVAAYFVITTILGARLAGKQSTIRDFFLGGRRMPWYAVAGSIVATELSAVTFVSVPFVVFKPGGDFTYLQLGLIGALLARLIVAFVLVPAYYKQEIYSPYDYMGQRLGSGVRGMTTALFTVGGILAQSARVYLTAVVLELILRDTMFAPLEQATGVSSMAWAIWTIGLVAVLWTLMGGITTVIWTDVILFLVFVIGAAVALLVVANQLDGGFGQMLQAGAEAGKFRLFDLDPDPTRDFTLWAAAIASTWFMVGIYGTDQLMAQRMFCCRSARDAKLAVISSIAGQGVTALLMLVGVGLFAYYQENPLSGESLALFQEKGDRIFPLFIINVIPAGLTGLIIAGIFAAAISSLDSILAALSQTSMSALYLPWRRRRRDRATADEDEGEQHHQVRVSRIFVVFWGVILCCAAQLIVQAAAFFPSILQLALAMATYAAGGLLAGFLLAFLPLRVNGFGFLFGAPLSVLFVFSLAWHSQPEQQGGMAWTAWVCYGGGGLLLLAFLLALSRRARPVTRPVSKTLALLIGIGVMILLNRYGTFERFDELGRSIRVNLAWPWFAPVGCTVAFLYGWLLADRDPRGDAT